MAGATGIACETHDHDDPSRIEPYCRVIASENASHRAAISVTERVRVPEATVTIDLCEIRDLEELDIVGTSLDQSDIAILESRIPKVISK